MKRIKMPLNFRMQNFMFLRNGRIFWTSASKTILQKIKRWWNKDKSEMCNTSGGFTLPFHGQYIRTDGFFLFHDLADDVEVYDLTTGKFIELLVGKSTLPYLSGVRALCPDKLLQGLSYNDEYTYAVFGSPGKGSIEVIDIKSRKKLKEFYYNNFKSKCWWGFLWSHWESENINYNLDGELEIGISVKTKTIFGPTINYRHKV